jgi:hypothetical protein
MHRVFWFRFQEVWRTLHKYGTDGPFFVVCYWRFESYFRMVRLELVDGPPRSHWQSAPSLQTVRPGHCRLPESFASCVVLLLWIGFKLVLRVGRSVATTWPWQVRVRTLACDFGTHSSSTLRRRIFIGSYSLPLSGCLIGPSVVLPPPPNPPSQPSSSVHKLLL